MNHNSIKTYNEYINYLKKHPDESKQLLYTLTVNVTELFRNPEMLKGDAKDLFEVVNNSSLMYKKP